MTHNPSYSPRARSPWLPHRGRAQAQDTHISERLWVSATSFRASGPLSPAVPFSPAMTSARADNFPRVGCAPGGPAMLVQSGSTGIDFTLRGGESRTQGAITSAGERSRRFLRFSHLTMTHRRIDRARTWSVSMAPTGGHRPIFTRRGRIRGGIARRSRRHVHSSISTETRGLARLGGSDCGAHTRPTASFPSTEYATGHSVQRCRALMVRRGTQDPPPGTRRRFHFPPILPDSRRQQCLSRSIA